MEAPINTIIEVYFAVLLIKIMSALEALIVFTKPRVTQNKHTQNSK
jgi:hypothetical protein